MEGIGICMGIVLMILLIGRTRTGYSGFMAEEDGPLEEAEEVNLIQGFPLEGEADTGRFMEMRAADFMVPNQNMGLCLEAPLGVVYM